MGTKSLEDISATLERAVESLRAGGAPRRKRMPLEAFVDHAAAEIVRASRDEPDVAKRRLATLKRSVDDVIAQVAKMAAEDTESASIQVEVSTAFAPTKSAGDSPMAELTTGEDQSSSETSLSASAAASAGTAFAASLAKIGKALAQMKAELEPAPGRKTRAPASKADTERDGTTADPREGGGDQAEAADPEDWPLDLNTDTFLQGAAADATALTWGVDPDEVGSPKRR